MRKFSSSLTHRWYVEITIHSNPESLIACNVTFKFIISNQITFNYSVICPSILPICF